MNDSTLQYQERVDKGRNRENKIIQGLKKYGFEIRPASYNDDILKGIDCYLKLNGRLHSLQIKVRQQSEDMLFVISEDDKLGKDMKTQAQLYAILVNNKMHVIESVNIRKTINDLIILTKQLKTNRVIYKGVECTLSHNTDPVRGSVKLMAFIPTDLFTDVIDPIIPAFYMDF